MRGRGRAGQHDGGFTAYGCKRADSGAGLQSHLLAGLCTADQDCGSAIDDTAGIACGVDVVDGFDFRVSLDGDVIESRLVAHHGEGGIQAAQAFQAGIGAHGFIMIQNDFPDVVPYRHDRLLK